MELDKFNRTLRQVLLLPVAACLVLAGILIWQFRGSNTIVGLIEQSDRRIALVTRVEKYVVDEETGLRGYQTTSDPRFLQPYRDAEAPMQQTIDELQSVSDPGPEEREYLRQFLIEHSTWRDAFAEPLIAMIAAGGQTRDIDLNFTGKSRMDAMRTHLDAIVAISERRRVDRIAQWNSEIRHVLLVLILLASAVGIFIGLFTRSRLNAVSAAFRKSLDMQHRRAEELFRSEQYLRTTLASIGDGVISCGVDGNVQMMNPVAQQLTGWTESQARNRPLDQIFHIVNETTRQPVENPVVKVQRLKRIVGMANHTILIRKDGSELSIDDSGSPIRNEAGELTGVVMVFRDITMERKTRAALLANEKLAVAGRLAATIAHEIHNPLDSVANLLYLLQHGSNEEEYKQFLQMAQSELARVTQISRAMLSLYRESVAPVPVNLKDMLDDLLLLMERRFQTLGVTVLASLPPDIAVEGFPAELRQVFNNLITNAAEAAGDGGNVAIRVISQPDGAAPSEAASGQKPEPGAIVEITDDGPGIPPEVRQHLFEPFFTTKGEKGTGLGLWVTQGIIRKHAGTIDITSQTDGPSHGTHVSVFLASKPMVNPGGD